VTDDRARGGKRRPSSHQGDDGPTSIDGPRIGDVPTNVDGPRIEAPADPHDTVSAELITFDDHADGGHADDDDDDDSQGEDPTIYRGDKPQKPSSSRRLSPTLMRIFQRKREQIGLSITQLAKLTGIEEAELMRFEGTNGQHRLVYDHAVLVARVLGIRPQDMPGLRSSKDPKDAVGAALGSLTTSLVSGPTLTFEGKTGERFGGDLERLGTTPHFAIKLGDGSLGEAWPKGTLMAFIMDSSPQPGDVVLVRNRRGKQLGLRRASGQAWVPLAPWQPSYPTGGDWVPVARLQAILPRA
jgi:hypothetical protein